MSEMLEGYVTPSKAAQLTGVPEAELRRMAWVGVIKHTWCCQEHGTVLDVHSVELYAVQRRQGVRPEPVGQEVRT